MNLENSTQTTVPTHVSVPTATPLRPAARTGLLYPPGIEDVQQRDVVREFLRWPMILSIPLSVAILSVIGMQSMLAAAPIAVLLATVATITAVHRASARVTSRQAVATVTALVPQPRMDTGL